MGGQDDNGGQAPIVSSPSDSLQEAITSTPTESASITPSHSRSPLRGRGYKPNQSQSRDFTQEFIQSAINGPATPAAEPKQPSQLKKPIIIGVIALVAIVAITGIAMAFKGGSNSTQDSGKTMTTQQAAEIMTENLESVRSVEAFAAAVSRGVISFSDILIKRTSKDEISGMKVGIENLKNILAEYSNIEQYEDDESLAKLKTAIDAHYEVYVAMVDDYEKIYNAGQAKNRIEEITNLAKNYSGDKGEALNGLVEDLSSLSSTIQEISKEGCDKIISNKCTNLIEEMNNINENLADGSPMMKFFSDVKELKESDEKSMYDYIIDILSLPEVSSAASNMRTNGVKK